MILLQINLIGVTVSKLECDAPRPIHMDRIARRPEAPQRMELRASEAHVLRTHSLIETVEQTQDAIEPAMVDPARPALAPQLGQAFMPERLYHPVNVIEMKTTVN